MRVRGDVGIARRERLGLLYRRRAHRRYLANMRCRPASGVSVRDQERAASCAASYAGRVTSETSNKSAAVTVRSRPSAVRVTRRSEEHTSELQSLMRSSYAVFCLTKKNNRHHYAC